jgi:CBS domain-containing protein
MNVGAVMATRVVAVEPTVSVQDAISRMVDEGIGSVAVCEGTQLVGILTERDVLRAAARRADFELLIVGEVMSRQLVKASPDTPLLHAARTMGERGIRHLPVVEGDNLLAVVGIRDVLRGLVERVGSDDAARKTAAELLRLG